MWALLIAAAVVTTPAATPAHERTTSYSVWEIRGRSAKVTLRLALLDASRFPWFAAAQAEARLQQYASQHLALVAGEAACTVDAPPRQLEAAPERLVFEWSVTCAATGPLIIQSSLLYDVAPTHLHFARVVRDGTALGEHVFSDAQRAWPLPADADSRAADTTATSFVAYLELGIEHILTGYDHLAFLLALLLIERTVAEVAKVITGFTIGHSITLALTSLGYVQPEGTAIEALIGLSIALVAAENLWLMARQPAIVPVVIAVGLALLAAVARAGYGVVPMLTLSGLALFTVCYFILLRRVDTPLRLRWAVAFLFGLVHGFGFASVLVEAGLPPGRLAQALLGFNLGVEAGQLAVVALVWPLALLAARPVRAHARQLALEVTSAAVLALGVFWFVTRAYG